MFLGALESCARPPFSNLMSRRAEAGRVVAPGARAAAVAARRSRTTQPDAVDEETRKLVTPPLHSRLDLALGLPPSNHIMVEDASNVHLDGNDLVAHHVQVLLADVSPQTSVLQR
jgi:hypothetical protein